MEIKISFSMLGRMFMLPASVVDEYLKITAGDFVKVLLCIYCLGKGTVNTEEVSKMAGVSEQTVKEAVIHFSKLGVISSDETAAMPVQEAVSEPVSQTASLNAESARDLKLIGGAEAVKGSKRDLSKASRVRFTPKEIARMIEEDSALKALVGDMEKLLAKPLTMSNTGDIVEMYEHMELSPASILMIAEYCKEREKCKTAYILKVAQEWFAEGISEFEQIEQKIIAMTEYSGYENKIKRIIGQSSNTTAKQREYINKWLAGGISEELVRLAYDMNIDNTGKLSFPYMNKVLEEWLKKGIKNEAQVKAEQEAHKQAASGQEGTKRGIDTKEYDEFANSIDFDKLST